MRLLIIQQKMIGDVLTTALLFEAIKKVYPKYELHYVVNQNTYPVVENNPYIDQFLFITTDIENSKVQFLKFLKSIRKEKYDIVIDAYSKLSSNLMTVFSGSKTRISKYKWYTSLIYSDPVKYSTERKTNAGLAIENRFQLLAPLAIELTPENKPCIYLNEDEINDSRQFLIKHQIDLNKPLIMIAVLGSGANKTYPFDYMASVVDLIVGQTKSQILFNYIPNQAEEAKAIYDLCNKETQKQIFFNVYGKNLRSFLSIMSHCDALIGNEGGAVNMSKALNIPTFTIFSPWIDKATWSIFEDDSNLSVHLNDFMPDIYSSTPIHKMKKRSLELYNKFHPELFETKLKSYLKHIINSSND